MKIFHYGGRPYQYTENKTEITLELGRYQNAYKIIQKFKTPEEAIAAYEAYIVSNGYKLRLRMNGVTIARKTSERE